MSDTTTVGPNGLVFYDAFRCGLIPCKVTGYSSDGMVTVKVTATRPAFPLGESLAARPNDVIPRGHVYTRNGHIRIRGTWRFEGLAEEFQPRWA
jgi:hypothetical protein